MVTKELNRNPRKYSSFISPSHFPSSFSHSQSKNQRPPALFGCLNRSYFSWSFSIIFSDLRVACGYYVHTLKIWGMEMWCSNFRNKVTRAILFSIYYLGMHAQTAKEVKATVHHAKMTRDDGLMSPKIYYYLWRLD